VTDFATLYKQNCAGCHGENGINGVAISLANPIYLKVAGEAKVRQVITNGVAGKLMPPFGTSAGGALTDQQINSLVEGMSKQWTRSDVPATLPPYSAASKGDSTQGQQAFTKFCARCHKTDGAGSIVDTSYLALVSDQSLRSTIIAGRPDEGMPDGRTMTDQEVTDIVAWLAAQR